MTAKHVTNLRHKVRKLFEFGVREKKFLRGKSNPLTGERALKVAARVNKGYLLYLECPAFDNVLEALVGPELDRQAAHIVTYLRNSEDAWRQIKNTHPRDLLKEAQDLDSDRQLALKLLGQVSNILSPNHQETLGALVERVKEEFWPVRRPINFQYLIASSHDNDAFAPVSESRQTPRTRPTFDLTLVGSRGASSKTESAWRALRVRTLDDRLPAGIVNRNAIIAELLKLGGESDITRQDVRSILAAKPKKSGKDVAK